MNAEAGYAFEYEARLAVIAVRFGPTLTDALCLRFYREAPRCLERHHDQNARPDCSCQTSSSAQTAITP